MVVRKVRALIRVSVVKRNVKHVVFCGGELVIICALIEDSSEDFACLLGFGVGLRPFE